MHKTKYSMIKKDFFKNLEATLDKSIIFQITDVYSECYYPIFADIRFKRVANDMSIDLALLSWSNDTQKYATIDKAYFTDFEDAQDIIEFAAKHYEPIVEKLFAMFKEVRYFWTFKEFFHKAENHTYIIHYKLLNDLPYNKWKELLDSMNFTPIIDIPLVKAIDDIRHTTIENIIRPIVFNGFYSNGVEISVDLDESDYPVYEYDGDRFKCGKITKEQIMEVVFG
ncbi:MAG: hypothetical protein RBQ81_05060 [Arcobacteraceae bacterium]|nr:hypothetical protein [Arcobacteraceae bacterium]MDY0365211.1 hypothetical protein [Arcobacteraceae bacterium]